MSTGGMAAATPATETVTAVNPSVSRVNPDGSNSPLIEVRENPDGTRPAEGRDENLRADQLALNGEKDDDYFNDLYDRVAGKEEENEPDGKTAQPRDPITKRFVKDPITGVETPVVDTAKDQTQTEQTEQTQAASAISMPQSWSADKKAIWEKVPPDAQKEISDRETAAHSYIGRQGQIISRFRPLGELISAYKDDFAKHNATPVAGIARLLDFQRKLDTNPEETFKAIAKAYNIDLARLAGASAGQTQTAEGAEAETAIPPVLQQTLEQLKQDNAALRKRLDTRDHTEQVKAHNTEIQLQRETEQDITKWSADKPHYSEVRTMMSTLIAAGNADSLDQAYEMACNAIPEVRTKVVAAKAEADKKAKAEEDAKAVSAAKRTAAIQVGGSNRTMQPARVGKKWDDDDTLGSLYDRVAAG